MGLLILDIEKEFQTVFGLKPKVGKVPDISEDQGGKAHINSVIPSTDDSKFLINSVKDSRISTKTGSLLLSKDTTGVDIWLPITLDNLPSNIGNNGSLELPYCVVRITGSSSIVRTPMVERKGSVKELYSVDDYKITIKGFFIDKAQRLFPEEDLINLRKIHEEGKNFKIRNALTNIFLDKDDRVIFSGFELPEVQGGRNHVRPFVMNIESDSVFTLEVA